VEGLGELAFGNDPDSFLVTDHFSSFFYH